MAMTKPFPARAALLRPACFVLVASISLAWPLGALAQMGQHGMMHHGADGTGHDEVNMPGLRGLDATPRESAHIGAGGDSAKSVCRTLRGRPSFTRSPVPRLNDK